MTSASSSTGGFSCALVTGALQPYAIDFYRALDASLRRRGASLIVLVGSRSTYRPWSSLGIQEDDPLFQFVGGKFAPAWIQRILGSSSRDKVFLPVFGKLHPKLNLPTAGVEYQLPFGGTKESSFGMREQGPLALDFYTESRTVYLKYSQ